MSAVGDNPRLILDGPGKISRRIRAAFPGNSG